jgi:TonB-linked SusC/RagA family outer membrane protein
MHSRKEEAVARTFNLIHLAVVTATLALSGTTAVAQRGTKLARADVSEPQRGGDAPANEGRVSFDVERTTVGRVLQEIESQSGIRLFYSADEVPLDAAVSVHLQRALPLEAVRAAVRGLPIEVVALAPDRIALQLRPADRSTRPATESPAAGPLAGIVVDAASQTPLEAAQVVVVGTALATATDAAGRFRFATVPGAQASLRVSRIGFRAATQEVTVPSSDVRVSLTVLPVQLGEMVVTGTAGAVERRSVGNAVATVSASEVAKTAPISNVGELLNGRVAGVVVSPGTGMIGSGPQIKIRGSSSVALTNEPLIYVDGVRVTNESGTGPSGVQGSQMVSRLGDINMNDIESMEVIKGPAAATLYGTEASNGVVQIITKRGRNAPPEWSFTTHQGRNWFMDAENRVPITWGRDAGGQLYSFNIFEHEKSLGNDIFRTGRNEGYSLSLRGGQEAVRYYAGGEYVNNAGIEPTNSERRLNARLNLGVSPSKALDVDLRMAVTGGRVNLAREEGVSVMWSTLFALPAQKDAPRRGFNVAPPEVFWDAYQDYQDIGRLTGGVQLNHRPRSWFTQRATIGIDRSHESNASIVQRMSPENARFFSAQAAIGSKDIDAREVTYTTADYGATANVPLREALTASISSGLQYYKKSFHFTSARGLGFPVGGLTTIAATAQTFGNEDFIENSTAGIYGQVQLAWRDRLFVTGALRADDNSAFGKEFAFVTYPKVSASYVLSDEPFFKVPGVDVLRLRGAYGVSGQQPDAFAALRSLAPVPGTGGGSALTPQTIGNPNLAPERGAELEAGFEGSLLHERLSVDFTYYDKRTHDAILLRDVAPSSGFPGQQYVNAGQVLNRGFEVQLTGRPYQGRKVDVELGLSLSKNRNEIVDLGGQDVIADGYVRNRVGYPIRSCAGRDGQGGEPDVRQHPGRRRRARAMRPGT